MKEIFPNGRIEKELTIVINQSIFPILFFLLTNNLKFFKANY
jgi:hypothetical protein